MSPAQRSAVRGFVHSASRGLLLITLAGAALVLSAMLFEFGLRLFAPVGDFFWQKDPVLGSRLIPNKRGRFVRPPDFDVAIAINSHGFHDREHTYKKPPGT